MTAGLEVTDLGVWLPGAGTVIERMSLTVRPGSACLVAGANGTGTTTLLRAIAGTLPPGARQAGQVSYAGQDLTGAHPDELRSRIGHCLGDLPAGLTASQLSPLAAVPARSLSTEVCERLGVARLPGQTIDGLDRSERTRVALANLLLRPPPVLLLDQPLGRVGSRWAQEVCLLLREYCDAGGALLWADHQLGEAWMTSDHVVELGTGGVPQRAETWVPRTLPLSVPHQLAVALRPAGDHMPIREAALRTALADRLVVPAARPRAARRGTVISVAVAGHREITVDPAEPPVILCESSSEAAACRDRLREAGNHCLAPLEYHDTVAGVARSVDRQRRLPTGSTARRLAARCRRLRLGDDLGSHSAGEQTLVRNELALAGPSPAVLYEPFDSLDLGQTAELVERIRQEWAAGRPVLPLTTDVEAAIRFPRVLVWGQAGPVADGRSGAVLESLPARPLLNRLLPGVTEVEVATAGLGDR